MSAAPDRNARLAWRLVAVVGGMLALAAIFFLLTLVRMGGQG